MPSAIFALCAAVVWGTSDFLGGRATRGSGALRVVFWTAMLASVLGILPALAVGVPADLAASLGWGALGGAAASLGAVALFHGIAHGRSAVVAPVSALVAAGLPVIVGLIAGENPGNLAWWGIGLAFPAIWLLTSESSLPGRGGLGHGLLAGLGFAAFFVAFGNAPTDAGLWPVVAGRATGAVLIGMLMLAGRSERIVGRLPWAVLVAVAGADASASWLYLQATRDGLVSLSAVLASLYPVPTVLLAMVFSRERLDLCHWLGVGAAVTSAVLISV